MVWYQLMLLCLLLPCSLPPRKICPILFLLLTEITMFNTNLYNKVAFYLAFFVSILILVVTLSKIINILENPTCMTEHDKRLVAFIAALAVASFTVITTSIIIMEARNFFIQIYFTGPLAAFVIVYILLTFSPNQLISIIIPGSGGDPNISDNCPLPPPTPTPLPSPSLSPCSDPNVRLGDRCI